MNKLVVAINGEAQFEFDRSKTLPDRQMEYLDKMDQQMDGGIPEGAGHIFSPDQSQRAQFVANQLITAIKANNEQLIAATMAYLALRMPDLQQVTAEEKDGQTTIKLIHDQAYTKAQEINFIKPESLNS
ncbi:MAG: hypothetical protein ACN4GM_00575 [Gammaproteobacteria bacterium]